MAKGKRDRRGRARHRSQPSGSQPAGPPRDSPGEPQAAGSPQSAGSSPRPGARTKLSAPSSDYRDQEGNVLTLRGSLTVGARQEYARALSGASARPGASREDNEQRAFELLFERLAVRWEIAGIPIEHQRELLARVRGATAEERAFVRKALRTHCAESFPELQAP